MIALSALFEDAEPNAFIEEFRLSLWSQAQKTLPKSVFDYSIKALRKALVSLRSAYGPVGSSLHYPSAENVQTRSSRHKKKRLK